MVKDFAAAPGATPLDPNEVEGLLPAHINTQSALNTWEEANIAAGERWALRQRRPELLEESFLRELHRRMFADTWKWAGKLRLSDKNLGVPWALVAVALRNLLDDVKAQVAQRSMHADELAVRFHHRLVSIHPFPNGNGRHARLMADLLAVKLGRPRFSWGSRQPAALTAPGQVRQDYIAALREADQGRMEALVKFARS